MKTTKKISSYLSKKELEEIKNQTDKDIAWVSCDLCNIKCNSQAMLDLVCFQINTSIRLNKWFKDEVLDFIQYHFKNQSVSIPNLSINFFFT